jgi:hypothetical protein
MTEHIKLYGPTLSNNRLQECFYSLYEPEIETVSAVLTSAAKTEKHLKHHLKEVPKFTKSYLLDKLELNTKTRCVLAWSGMMISVF